MIGKATWTEETTTTIVTLFEDGHWTVTREAGGETVDDTGAAEFLRVYYEDDYGGPADGPYGHRILNDLAARHNGTAWFEPKRHAPEGTVY